MREILVTGATGCIGRAVVLAALQSGWSVRGLARSERPRWWPEAAAFIRGSVEDVEVVAEAVDGVDTVVHLAAPAHESDASPEAVAVRHRVTVEGTTNVARAARVGGSRFVLMSSVAVYGNPPPRVSSQDTTPHPTTAYGLAKLEAEKRCRAELPEAIVLRSSVVYGPGDRGNVRRLIEAVDRGRAVVVGDGRNRKSLLFSGNLADRILLCADRGSSGTWCVADSPAPTQRDLLAEITRSLGRPRPRSVPAGLAAAGARVVDIVSTLRGRSGRWSSAIKTLTSWSEVDGSALDARLGYRRAVPLDDALARTIAWLRTESEVTPWT